MFFFEKSDIQKCDVFLSFIKTIIPYDDSLIFKGSVEHCHAVPWALWGKDRKKGTFHIIRDGEKENLRKKMSGFV